MTKRMTALIKRLEDKKAKKSSYHLALPEIYLLLDYLLNSDKNVQGSDTTEADSSNADGSPNNSVEVDESIDPDDYLYESIYMEVVELVEKDNIQCEAYKETAKKLMSKYKIERL